jgi:hypothetical protein
MRVGLAHRQSVLGLDAAEGEKSRSHRPLQYNTDTVPEILYLHFNIAIFVRPFNMPLGI